MATADRLPRGNTDAPLAVGTAVGELEITGKVAQGGMGAIYAAIHPLIGKKAGDSVEVNTPRGAKSYEILKVAFLG